MKKKIYIYSLLCMFVSGALDAYTLLLRGGVFAAMQTGNLIYFCINLVKGNFSLLYKYVFSIIAFCLGIFAEHLIKRCKNGTKISVALIVIFYAAGFAIPYGKPDFVANMLFSFAVAIQLQLIRSIDSFVIASTMCTGNLRSLVECVASLITEKGERAKYKRGIVIYSTLILAFMTGVAVVAALVHYLS
ncbi:MAG: YoaK family protein [Eubacteriales bacterium]